MNFKTTIVAVLVALILTACGGGGSGSSGADAPGNNGDTGSSGDTGSNGGNSDSDNDTDNDGNGSSTDNNGDTDGGNRPDDDGNTDGNSGGNTGGDTGGDGEGDEGDDSAGKGDAPPLGTVIMQGPKDASLSGDSELGSDFIDLAKGTVTWNITTEVDGNYKVEFDVSSPHDQKVNTIFINSFRDEITTPKSDAITTLSYNDVFLEAGQQSLGVDSQPNGWGFINVHALRVTLEERVVNVPEPRITPSQQIFYIDDAAPLSFNLDLDGDDVSSVSVGGTPLNPETQYVLTENALTLNVSYLETIGLGNSVRITVNFAEANPVNVNISVRSAADGAGNPGTNPGSGFVYVTPDGHFGLNGKYFYNNGSNHYFMFYKHPLMVLDVLDTMQEQKMTSLRAWGFCDGDYYGRPEHSGYWDPIFGAGNAAEGHCFQPENPDTVSADKRFNEVGFRQLDFMIQQAAERGIKVVLPLTNYWGGFGGMCQYAAWSPNIDVDKDGDTNDADDAMQCYRVEVRQRYAERFTATTPEFVQKYEQDYKATITDGPEGYEDFHFIVDAAAQFYGDEWSQRRFREYIDYVLNRTNHLTGKKYKDDPAIMMWELANEPRCVRCTEQQRADFHKWIDETSKYIKSIDSKHLVSTGMEGFDKSNPWEARQRAELVDEGATQAEAEATIPVEYKEGTDFVEDHNYVAIDAYSLHLYPDWWGLSEQETKDFIRTRVEKAREGGKPIYVGEYGRMIEFDKDNMYDYQHWDGRDGISQEERDRVYSEWLALADDLNIDGMMVWLISGMDYWERDDIDPWTFNNSVDFGNKQKFCFAPEDEADRTSHPGESANLQSWTCDGLYNDWDRFTIYCNDIQNDAVCDTLTSYSDIVEQKNIDDGTGFGDSQGEDPDDGPSTPPVDDNDDNDESSSTKGETIYIEGNDIYLADGTPFLMRGVNLQYGDSPSTKFPSIEHIAATGANIVRLQLRADTSATQLRDALDEIIKYNMIAMPMYWENGSRGRYHITGGDNTRAIDDGDISDEDAVGLWLNVWGDVIRDPKYRAFIMVNIANEWGQNANVWRDTYVDAVKALRDGGFEMPLVIDAGDWGHNPYYFVGGDEILEADKLHNTIFSVHGYFEWSTEKEIDDRIQYMLDTDLPVIIGEFGRTNHHAGGKTTDHHYLMERAAEENLGWIAWSWRGNGQGETMLDMSHSYTAYDLTEHGEDVVDGKNGIKAVNVTIPGIYFTSDHSADTGNDDNAGNPGQDSGSGGGASGDTGSEDSGGSSGDAQGSQTSCSSDAHCPDGEVCAQWPSYVCVVPDQSSAFVP